MIMPAEDFGSQNFVCNMMGVTVINFNTTIKISRPASSNIPYGFTFFKSTLRVLMFQEHMFAILYYELWKFYKKVGCTIQISRINLLYHDL